MAGTEFAIEHPLDKGSTEWIKVRNPEFQFEIGLLPATAWRRWGFSAERDAASGRRSFVPLPRAWPVQSHLAARDAIRLVIFAIVLVIFGPKKLPDLARGLGHAIRGFKEEMRKGEEEDTPPTKP